jgi:aminopeptidase N
MRTLTAALLAGLSAAFAADGATREEDYGCGCLAHRLEAFQPARRSDRPGRWVEPGKGKFDAATGADFRNWPPDRLVDYLKIRIELKVADLAARTADGVAIFTVRPIAGPVESLSLNAEQMKVSKVSVGGRPVEFSSDGHVLGLRFEPALAAGADSEIRVEYSLENPPMGLTFSPAYPDRAGYPAEMHTQGQTEFNRGWFPCHDFPNERQSTELVVDVPEGLVVSGNGRLVSQRTEGGRSVWHWLQEKPHVAYLVSMVAGDFARVPIDNRLSGVPMHVWVPKDRVADVERTYGRTDRMMALFERVFGEKYPWDRYDQLVVRNFGSGGMENTSATTMHPGAIFDEIAAADDDMDGLISHELCHQWTGDLITCRSWAHIWLNEGWATYGANLWVQERDGEAGYFDAMLDSNGVAGGDSTEGPVGMVSPIYGQAGETFSRAPNPYPKGASILHMLREKLGDEVFFKGVHAYFDRYKFDLAETDDFRKELEAASGLGLEGFFDQWCMRPGCPNITVKASYDTANRMLRVTADQTQKIDERTPAFAVDTPVVVKTATGVRTFPWSWRTKADTLEVQLDGPPEWVAFDPRLATLKTLKQEMPVEWMRALAKDGPTTAARRQAVQFLRGNAAPDTVAVLEAIAVDPAQRRRLRQECVDAIADFQCEAGRAALARMMEKPPELPRVFASVCTAVTQLGDKPKAVAWLAKTLQEQRSYAVRTACINALGKLEAKDQAELLLKMVDEPSRQQEIQGAALGVLAGWGEAKAVEPAMKAATLGNFDRARPAAMDALAKLCPKEEDNATRKTIIEKLIAWMDDPEGRARNAACEALANVKAKQALDRLDAIARSDPSAERRDRAAEWAKRIRG